MFEKIVNENKQFTTITVTWKADFDELMSVIENFYDGNNTKHLLVDFRDCSFDTITHHHIRSLCEYSKSRANGVRRVNGKTALVGSNDLQFEIGMIFKRYSEMIESDIKFSVFRSIEQALSWLEEFDSHFDTKTINLMQ